MKTSIASELVFIGLSLAQFTHKNTQLYLHYGNKRYLLDIPVISNTII